MFFKSSKEEKEKYGMTDMDKNFEVLSLAMVVVSMIAFFLKIIFF